MAKIDLDSLGIEELVALRESATAKLMEKVAARRADLEAELERLAQYNKLAKKSLDAAPVAKTKKSGERKSDELQDPIARAA
jgi:hypothetical protein